MKFNGCYYSNGSVRQLMKRPGKPWQGVLKYKDGENWHSVSRMLTSAKGKKDAERLLQEWQKEMETSADVAKIRGAKGKRVSLNKSVAEVVYRYIDEQFANGELQLSTYVQQKDMFKKRAEPYIGDIAFDELTKAQIQEWLRILEYEKKYKWSTKRNVWKVVKKTYNHYSEEGVIVVNPCKGIRLKNNELQEINSMNPLQMEYFLSCLDGYGRFPWYRNLFEIPLWTGMRTEEVCGLTWADVNLVADYLTINRAIGQVRSGKWETYVKVPKFACSRRKIPLLPQAKEILEKQYEYQLEQCKKKNPKAREVPLNHYCFGPYDGEDYCYPMRVSTAFINFCRRYNVVGITGKRLSMHGLRHTFATLAVASKMDIKSVSSVLGHADAAMTLNTYAAADEDAIRGGMKKLGEFLSQRQEEAGYIDV